MAPAATRCERTNCWRAHAGWGRLSAEERLRGPEPAAYSMDVYRLQPVLLGLRPGRPPAVRVAGRQRLPALEHRTTGHGRTRQPRAFAGGIRPDVEADVVRFEPGPPLK